MGSAVSSISKEQAAKLTRTLKEKYEEYQAGGVPDAEIQSKLTKEYYNLLEVIKAEEKATAAPIATGVESTKLSKATGKTESSSSTSKLRSSFEGKVEPKVEPKGVELKAGMSSKVGLSSKMNSNVSSKGGSSTKGGGSRRRSFDDNKKSGPAATAAAVAAAQEALKKAEEAANEAAAVVPPPEEVQADSWDSISQQPFCTLCQMAFKSMSFLERHVKYSDLHIRNAKKAADVANPAPPPISEADNDMFVTSESGKVTPKQVEGKHYRLLYSGSKLFWRTQETVDLNIYHHILPSTIEVVSYDTAKSKEMNRIYMDYAALCDLSGVTAMAQASAGARAAAARAAAAREMEATSTKGTAANAAQIAATQAADAAAAAAADPTTVVDETTMLARYIIQRLQMGAAVATSSMKRMEFVKLSSDTYTKSPIMEKVPVVLVPISVARRRRTNAEEIEATMNSLATDRAALAEATSHAHKVANVVYTSATSIAAKKWWADFNPVRKKWVWAIRRVIRQKLVAETTAVLVALEAAKKKEQLKRGYSVAPSGRGASKEV